MSGGSFNYLSSRSAEDFLENFEYVDALDSMAEELNRYGELGQAAREKTLNLYSEIVQIRTQMDELKQQLEEKFQRAKASGIKTVWDTAEWCCSNDTSEEKVIEVLKQFNDKLTEA